MNLGLRGKKAIVCASSKGLGFEICNRLISLKKDVFGISRNTSFLTFPSHSGGHVHSAGVPLGRRRCATTAMHVHSTGVPPGRRRCVAAQFP